MDPEGHDIAPEPGSDDTLREGATPADQEQRTPEEVRRLSGWARKHLSNGGHGVPFDQIEKARNRWVRRNQILLTAGLLTVIGGGTAAATHTDEIGQWYEDSAKPWIGEQADAVSDWAGEQADAFGAWWGNGHQRADYPGVTPTDPSLALRLDCLAEEFHDQDAAASITHFHVGENSWKKRHCEGVLDDIYADPHFETDPITLMANKKNEVMRALGVQDRDDRHPTVGWRSYGGLIGHRFYTDQQRLEQAYKAQTRNGGKPRFRFK